MKIDLGSTRAAVSQPSVGYDLLRIYLGVALFVRGALFVADPTKVLDLVRKSGDWFWPLLIAHYVGMAHLGGGILLAIGLATRVAAAIQVPILFGAVFFVHWNDGILSAGEGLELAGLVLVMLLIFTVFGAGPISFESRARASARAARERDALADADEQEQRERCLEAEGHAHVSAH